MKNNILKTIALLFIIILLIVGCREKPNLVGTREDGGKDGNGLKVYTSFYPYYEFAKNIGGDKAHIHTIIPHGTEPHSFEPSSRLIAGLEEADIFIYNGVHMEPWLDKVLNILEGKNIYLVDASKAVELISYNKNFDDDKEQQGQEDPHIWVDPVNAIDISKSIKDAFVSIDSKNRHIYENNFNNFRIQLEELDRAFRDGLKNITQRKIIVSHSAFGYLAKRYNIEQIAVAGVSPHAEPSPKRLAELSKVAKDNEINYIFLEALASVKTAEILAKEANLEILTLYIVEGLTEEEQDKGENYISLMYKNLETLKKALVK